MDASYLRRAIISSLCILSTLTIGAILRKNFVGSGKSSSSASSSAVYEYGSFIKPGEIKSNLIYAGFETDYDDEFEGKNFECERLRCWTDAGAYLDITYCHSEEEAKEIFREYKSIYGIEQGKQCYAVKYTGSIAYIVSDEGTYKLSGIKD